MLLVCGEKIEFRYETQVENLLQRADFSVNSKSRIGVIGKNGSGKSTLLKILLGELKPTSGSMQRASCLKLGLINQRINTKDQVEDFIWSELPELANIKKRMDRVHAPGQVADWMAFSDFEQAHGYETQIAIEKWLDEFKLDPSVLNRSMASLSGGERTKIALVRSLIAEPNLLLLDEPTNNLDQSMIEWLIVFLQKIEIPFIVVSHDRHLLNESTSEIWDIEKGFLRHYSGNYDFYKAMVEQKRLSDFEMYSLQKTKVKNLKSAANQRRVDARRMESFKQTRSVKKNGGICKKDEGSGSAMANPNKKMRSALALESRIEQMIEKEEAKKPWIEKKRRLGLPLGTPCHSQIVIEVKDLSLSYAEKLVFNNLNFTIRNGERVALVGNNGSGKSSLIRILSGELSATSGSCNWAASASVAVLSQESQCLEKGVSVLNEVWRSETVEESRVRTVLGSLGLGQTMVHQKVGTISPGEQMKVALAKIILSGANVLLLDEPTNHLETSGCEMLQDALSEFKGTLLLVSHDRVFREGITTRFIELSKLSH